ERALGVVLVAVAGLKDDQVARSEGRQEFALFEQFNGRAGGTLAQQVGPILSRLARAGKYLVEHAHEAILRCREGRSEHHAEKRTHDMRKAPPRFSPRPAPQRTGSPRRSSTRTGERQPACFRETHPGTNTDRSRGPCS